MYFLVILISIVCDLERFKERSLQTDHLSRIVCSGHTIGLTCNKATLLSKDFFVGFRKALARSRIGHHDHKCK